MLPYVKETMKFSKIQYFRDYLKLSMILQDDPKDKYLSIARLRDIFLKFPDILFYLQANFCICTFMEK